MKNSSDTPSRRQRTGDWLWLTAGGVIGGLLASGGLALVGRFVGASSPTGWGDLVGAVSGLLLGAPVGSMLGLWAVGCWCGYQRLWLIVPSVIVSMGLLLLLADPLRINASPILLLSLLVTVPAVVATVVLARNQD